jgi:hypothetical protein
MLNNMGVRKNSKKQETTPLFGPDMSYKQAVNILKDSLRETSNWQK